MVERGTVTAVEEVQRYFRKAKAIAQPLVNQIKTKDATKDSSAEDEAAEDMFEDDIDSEDGDWNDENNEESHRLSTGTGPTQVARGVVQHKLLELGAATATKVSQVPGAARVCAENQSERLAEVAGRVTVPNVVSKSMTRLLQRYPLMDRWRVAFFRGRGEDVQAIVATSPPPETPSSSQEEDLLSELPQFFGDDEMEDVPLGVEDNYEDEDWDNAQ